LIEEAAPRAPLFLLSICHASSAIALAPVAPDIFVINDGDAS